MFGTDTSVLRYPKELNATREENRDVFCLRVRYFEQSQIRPQTSECRVLVSRNKGGRLEPQVDHPDRKVDFRSGHVDRGDAEEGPLDHVAYATSDEPYIYAFM